MEMVKNATANVIAKADKNPKRVILFPLSVACHFSNI